MTQKSQEKKTQSHDTGQKSEKTKKLLEDLQSGRVTASLGKMPISFNLDPENIVYLKFLIFLPRCLELVKELGKELG